MIKSKNKPCIICGSDKYPWFSKRRCKSCSQKGYGKTTQANQKAKRFTNSVVDENEIDPEPKELFPKKNENDIEGNLIQELDTIFSIYIRQKYADKQGLVKCFTCRLKFHWENIQNGHGHSRKHMATRWDENNCRPQCKNCNCYKDGRNDVFKANLILEIGEEAVDAIGVKARGISKLADFELQEMIDNYKKLVASFTHIQPDPDK